MAGIFDGIVKGIVNLAPQDNPDVMIFNSQTEIKELLEKENELFEELGRKVYEDGGKEKYPEIATQLDEIKAKKEELENKIKELKNEKELAEQASNDDVECSNCGAMNTKGAKFCSGCGGKLPELSNKRFCTSCGAEVAEGMRFCSGCGAAQP